MNTETFASFLHDHPRVLVKFSAKWCGPCKAMEPGLRQLESEANFPPVLRIDVEEDAELAGHYGIRAMPTLMVFEHGRPVKTQVGALSPAQLQAFIEPAGC